MKLRRFLIFNQGYSLQVYPLSKPRTVQKLTTDRLKILLFPSIQSKCLLNFEIEGLSIYEIQRHCEWCDFLNDQYRFRQFVVNFVQLYTSFQSSGEDYFCCQHFHLSHFNFHLFLEVSLWEITLRSLVLRQCSSALFWDWLTVKVYPLDTQS